ncbi:MAG: hypothetical protein IJU37_05660 [Desulfovibrio sp.]|nr:hypothetical protein [Desulfovibrio sp.]
MGEENLPEDVRQVFDALLAREEDVRQSQRGNARREQSAELAPEIAPERKTVQPDQLSEPPSETVSPEAPEDIPEGGVVRRSSLPETNRQTPRQNVNTADELYALAEETRDSFQGVIQGIADDTGGTALFRASPDGRAGLKFRERAEEKVNRDYDGTGYDRIVDVLGGTILYDAKAGIQDALPNVFQKVEAIGGKVVRVKDRFANPSGGYRDVLINIEMPNGMKTELLVTTKAMSEAKNGLGHKLYEATQVVDEIIAKEKLEGDRLRAAENTRNALRKAMGNYYESTGEESNSTASVSVIEKPLYMTSAYLPFLSSSSLYPKLESLLRTISNNLPSDVKAKGLSLYSTKSSITTGASGEPSSQVSPDISRPSNERTISGREESIQTPPSNDNAIAENSVENKGGQTEAQETATAPETVPDTLNAVGGGTTIPVVPNKPVVPPNSKLSHKDAIALSSVVESIGKALDVPIRTGKLGPVARGVLGIFKHKPEVIRTRMDNDVATVMHEAGHYIQKAIFDGDMSGKPLRPYAAELAPLATKPKAGQSPLPEGFAEFVAKYVCDPKEAQKLAPNFYSTFETLLEQKSPEFKTALLNARDVVRKWAEQPAAQEVLSHINIEGRENEGILARALSRDTWERIYTNFVDKLYPLKKATDLLAQGQELPADVNPYTLARTFAGAKGKATHFLEHSPFKFGNWENVGKPLAATLKAVENLDEFRAYLVSRRGLELEDRGIASGIRREAMEATRQQFEAKYESLAKELDEYQDHVVNYLVDSGVMVSIRM